MSHFALQATLASIVKATNAKCGGIFSLWNPANATLASVELIEDAATTMTTMAGGAPPHRADVNASSFARNQFLSEIMKVEDGGASENASFASAAPSPKSATTRQQQQQLQSQPSDDIAAMTSNFENFSFAPSHEDAIALAAAAAAAATSAQPSKAVTTEDPQTPSDAAKRGGNLAATMTTTAARAPPPATAAAVPPPVIASTASARAALHSAAALSRCVALAGEPSELLLRATTPEIQNAVARSGIAVHCTATAAPYLVMPIVASTLAVEPLYTAVTRRLLQHSCFNRNQVVVGLLVLVGREPASSSNGGAEDDDLLALLGGGGGEVDDAAPGGEGKNHGRRRLSAMLGAGADDDERSRATSIIRRQVSFRAEDEALAEALCRTVLSEVLTTREGVFSKEQNLNVFLNKLTAADVAEQQQQHQHPTKKRGGRGGGTSPQKQPPQQVASSSNVLNTTASFRAAARPQPQQQQQQQQPEPTDFSETLLLSQTNSRLLLGGGNNMNASFRKLQSAAARVAAMSASCANIMSPSPAGFGGGGSINANLNASLRAAIEFPGGAVGAPGNSAQRFPSPAAATDFWRNTMCPVRVAKIIRIPDTTIALTAKGILSQRAGSFSAIPDLREVRRVVEDQEKVVDALRNDNMNLLRNAQEQQQHGGATLGGGGKNNNNGASLREGMEKLEMRLARMRTENTALRNHVDMLQHRLDSTLRAKSIAREFPVATSTTLGAHLFSADSSSDDDQQDGNALRRSQLNSRQSSTAGASSARRGGGPRPPTSQQQQQPLRGKKPSAHDELPPSVLLELKAVEGLDKLKRELAFQRQQRRHNG